MIRNPHLNTPGPTARKDKRIIHDWRPPAAYDAERVIDELENRIECARDELVNDFHRTAKRLGCRDHFTDAPGDPLSVTAYDEKVEKAFGAFRRRLR
jgi:hypothetical protein